MNRHKPVLRAGDYAAQIRGDMPNQRAGVERALTKPKSVYQIADETGYPISAILGVVRSTPGRFLERDGLIHRI